VAATGYFFQALFFRAVLAEQLVFLLNQMRKLAVFFQDKVK
jgi:hypothetical protein